MDQESQEVSCVVCVRYVLTSEEQKSKLAMYKVLTDFVTKPENIINHFLICKNFLFSKFGLLIQFSLASLTVTPSRV